VIGLSETDPLGIFKICCHSKLLFGIGLASGGLSSCKIECGPSHEKMSKTLPRMASRELHRRLIKKIFWGDVANRTQNREDM